MTDSVLADLRAATKGLLYTTEQDAPIKAFVWSKADVGSHAITPDSVRRLARISSGAPVETQSVEDFFRPIDQGQLLRNAVGRLLSGVQVFRFGTTDKTVVLVGRTADGDSAGVMTRAVET